jgi:hypothetical protein
VIRTKLIEVVAHEVLFATSTITNSTSEYIEARKDMRKKWAVGSSTITTKGKTEKCRISTSVSRKGEYSRIVLPPCGTGRSVIVAMPFPETTVLFSNTCKTTSLSSLVHWINDPTDTGVATYLKAYVSMAAPTTPKQSYRLMIRVDENNFIIFIYTVLIDPIRVKDAQVTATTTNALFCG